MGTLGAAALDFADEAFWRGYKGLPEQVSKLTGGRRSIWKDMLLKRAIDVTPLSSTRQSEKMFEVADTAKARAEALDKHSQLLNDFDKKEYKRLLDDPDTAMLLHVNSVFNSYLKAIADYSSQIKQINAMGPKTINAAEKVKELGYLTQARNDLLEQLSEVYGDIRAGYDK